MAVIMRSAHTHTHTHTLTLWELCQAGKTCRARLPLAHCHQAINKLRRRDERRGRVGKEEVRRKERETQKQRGRNGRGN